MRKHPTHHSQHLCLSSVCAVLHGVAGEEGEKRVKSGKYSKSLKLPEWAESSTVTGWHYLSLRSIRGHVSWYVRIDCGVWMCLRWFVGLEKWSFFEDLWKLNCETLGGENLEREYHNTSLTYCTENRSHFMCIVSCADFSHCDPCNKNDKQRRSRERTTNTDSQNTQQLIYQWLRLVERVMFGVIGLGRSHWMKIDFCFRNFWTEQKRQIYATSNNSLVSSNITIVEAFLFQENVRMSQIWVK